MHADSLAAHGCRSGIGLGARRRCAYAPGAKAHPGGGDTMFGGDPGIGIEPLAGPSSAASRADPGCTGGCSAANRSSTERSLDRPTGVHHLHPVGDARDHAEVVGDQHDRRLQVLLDALHDVEDLRLDRDVERRRRLVGDEHVGLVGDRHRDHHPLAHAAGELVGILLARGGRAAECRRCRAARPPWRALPPCDIDSCDRIISTIWSPILWTGFSADSGSWKIIAIRLPRIARSLLATSSRPAPRPAIRADPSMIADFGSRPISPRNVTDLPGTGLADDADHLAGVDVEVDAADRLHRAVDGRERDPEVAEGQMRIRTSVSLPGSSLGSVASRRPSPMKLMHTATSDQQRHTGTRPSTKDRRGRRSWTATRGCRSTSARTRRRDRTRRTTASPRRRSPPRRSWSAPRASDRSSWAAGGAATIRRIGRTERARRLDELAFLQGQHRASHESRHAHPAEDDEEEDDEPDRGSSHR